MEKKEKFIPKDSAKETGAVRHKKNFGKKAKFTKKAVDTTDSTGAHSSVGYPGNDYSWWNKVPELTENSVNILNNLIAGTEVDPYAIQFIPNGVCCVELLPMAGSDASADGPINVTFRDLFVKMFQKYRGITAYQAADLGIVILGMIDVVRTIAQCERIYGILASYPALTRNIPDTLLNALGLTLANADVLRRHMSEFRYGLNTLIRKAQRFFIPKGMSVVANAISLLGYVYKDHESPKSQLIVFKTAGGYVFKETTFTTGSSLVFQDTDAFGSATSLININSAGELEFPFLETQINALLGSDSVQKIMGDLFTWFGEEQALNFEPVPADYRVIPVYSEEILHKFHNLTSLEVWNGSNNALLSVISNLLTNAADIAYLSVGSRDIYQANNVIISKMFVQNGSNVDYVYDTGFGYKVLANSSMPAYMTVGGGSVLDTYHTDFGPEIVMEGCLFKTSLREFYDVPNSAWAVGIDSCVDYVVGHIRIVRNLQGGGFIGTNIETNFDNSRIADANEDAARLAAFDWAPLVYFHDAGTTATVPVQLLLGEYDNMRYLTGSELRDIHSAACYSGFKPDLVVLTK